MKRRPEPVGGPLGTVGEALFRIAVAARNRCYDRGLLRSTRLEVPVVSVGNLTAGGTGKTPIAIALTGILLREGWRPALLSRGYGREGGGRLLAFPPGEVPGPGGHLRYGDEPCLFRIRHPSVPIVLGADRARGGRLAVRRFGADLLLLDDGMQHRALRRDLEIVLVHGLHPFGNGRLLPRGTLREPPASIGRADAVLVQTTEGERDDLPALLDRAGAPPLRIPFRYEAESVRPPAGPPADAGAFLPGRAVLAVSGTGRPESFETLLRKSGADVRGGLRFPDHHRFAPGDLERIREEAARLGAIPLATEKDRVRLSDDDALRLHLHTLAIQVMTNDPEGRLDALLAGLRKERPR
jgi:tetraacyldisaccharide 4'-kinase